MGYQWLTCFPRPFPGLLTALQKLAKLSTDDTSSVPDYFGGRKAAIDAA